MITVFYANLVYEQYRDWLDFKHMHRIDEISEEVWQGCFIYQHNSRSWWKSDQTPYLEDQINPALKAWVLLLD